MSVLKSLSSREPQNAADSHISRCEVSVQHSEAHICMGMGQGLCKVSFMRLSKAILHPLTQKHLQKHLVTRLPAAWVGHDLMNHRKATQKCP